MKKLLLFYFTLLFFSPLLWRGAGGEASAQNPLVKQWDKRFGGTTADWLYSIQQTKDGGFILGGYSQSGIGGDKTQPLWGGTGDYDYWIVKTDSFGNKEWDKDLGGTDIEWFSSIQQTADGGFILAGSSWSGIGGDKTQANWDTFTYTADYWILKTDSLGNKQWDKDFGGENDDFLYSIEQTKDGGFILGGYSQSGIGGDKTQALVGVTDYWIIKTDSLGNKQWDKDFGGTNDNELYSIQQTADDGFIFGGTSNSGIGGDKTQNSWGWIDYWIVKADSLGNKQWDKDFGGIYNDELFSILQTTDGGFILGGYSKSEIGGDKTQPLWGGAGDYDFWIVKTDSLGNKQWDKDFGGIDKEDEFGNIFQTTDGGYLIAGTSYSNISGNKTENNLGFEQSWILKTDSIGNKQWDKTLHTSTGISQHDEIGYAIQTRDGCYLMANCTAGGIGGDKIQTSQGSYDYWIIKFCDSTLTTSLTPALSKGERVAINPNPSSGNFTITLPYLINKGKVEIYNSFGEKIVTENILNTSQKEIHLKTSPGIYFVKVMDARPDEHPFGRGEKQYSSKIVIE